MAFFKFGSLVQRILSTATSGTTITLIKSSQTSQQLTGSTAQLVILPDATTLSVGWKTVISNRSTAMATVQDGSSTFLAFIAPGTERVFKTSSISAQAGVWDVSTGPSGIDSPLRIFQSSPPDAKLNFTANTIYAADGTQLISAPINATIPSVAASTVNFQSGATTGATFTGFTLPTTTTGFYTRCGFTLLSSGNIQAIFASPNSVFASLANPGTLFGAGTPIGYVDLVATASSAYKTVNSSTSIIEANPTGVAAIHRFGSGGGSSSSQSITNGLQWVESTNSPTPSVDAVGSRIYSFDAGLGQTLYAEFKVPSWYVTGTQINLNLPFYTPGTTGNVLFTATTTLIRNTVDNFNSTSLQYTSTNTAVSLPGGANIPKMVTIDLTSSTGQIGSTNVSYTAGGAYGRILVAITRGTDATTQTANLLVNSTELTFP